MLCSLFHCFDPYVMIVSFSFPMKWMVVVFLFIFLSWQLNVFTVGLDLILKCITSLIWNAFSSLIDKLDKSFLMLFSLILMIYGMNVLGLIPFVFTISSHLSSNLSFSISLWMGGVVYSLMKSIDGFLSHLVPTGTPMVLWFFLVLVESVSQVIRPFTLSIRLMANVMAGHLIMNLLGQFISSSFTNVFLLFFQSGFLMFEQCISMVQAYVFVSLLSLYWNES